MTKAKKKSIITIGTASAAIVVLALLYFFNPVETPFAPKCIFHVYVAKTSFPLLFQRKIAPAWSPRSRRSPFLPGLARKPQKPFDAGLLAHGVASLMMYPAGYGGQTSHHCGSKRRGVNSERSGIEGSQIVRYMSENRDSSSSRSSK